MSLNKTMACKCHNGIFKGKREEATGVISFKGIPYAKQPVGALRWKKPEPGDASDETFEAYEFGKSCYQSPLESEPASMNVQGEDCLTLNIWTADLEKKNKPVMVYFHGGAFVLGGSADPLYDGQYFVRQEQDILMVTANYRIGMYGFIDFSHIPGGEEYPDSKNLGLYDHVMVLEWIRENIEAFGGDPGNVTIFGESAGGATTSQLLLVKEAEGLFHRCISQSGGLNLTFDQNDYDEIGQADLLLKLSGCSNMAELAALPEDELAKIYLTPLKDGKFTDNEEDADDGLCFHFNMPSRDGKFLPEKPYEALKSGASLKVDLMTGSNKDEWNYWLDTFLIEMKMPMEEALVEYDKYTIQEKIEILDSQTDDREKELVEEFLKICGKEDEIWAKTELFNDLVFRLPAIKAAEYHSEAGGRSYMYYFAKESDVIGMGACHASECAYTFHNLTGAGFSGTMDAGLADKMCAMWAAFARTGDPSIEGIKWPEYDSEKRLTMVMKNDGSTEVVSDPLPEQRKLTEPLLKYYTK